MGQLRPLESADAVKVRSFLGRHPDRDVYLCGLVWRLGVVLPAGAGTLMGWFVGPELRGVFLHASVVVLACEDDDGLAAFAAHVAGHIDGVPLMQVISPARMTAALFDGLRAADALPRPRLFRACMPTLRVDRSRLLPRDSLTPPPGCLLPAPVRHATDREHRIVRDACIAVTTEELGIDPERLDPTGFRVALTRRLRAGREYIWVEDGRLLFRAALSATTPQSVLVEGVYTPPAERGRRIGTVAMHALCERLLKLHERVVLFVGDDNTRARRLYDRLGFEQIGEYQAAYFHPPGASTPT